MGARGQGDQLPAELLNGVYRLVTSNDWREYCNYLFLLSYLTFGFSMHGVTSPGSGR